MTSRRNPVAATLKHPMVDYNFRTAIERHLFHAVEEGPYWDSQRFLGLPFVGSIRRWDRHHEMSRTVESHVYDD